MNSSKANKLIQKMSEEINKNGIDTDSLVSQLKELREMAKLENDPVVTRSIRMAYEHLENNEGWEFPVIKPEEDEDVIEDEEQEDIEYSDIEHLTAFLSMLEKSDNKYNKDELRNIANELNDY